MERPPHRSKADPGLSVVIPTLDAEATVADAIRSAPAGAEVVVVDGGSADATVETAARALEASSPGPPQVLVTAPGRAAQLNRGAAAARGRTLLFLHADCVLPPRAGAEIRRILKASEVVGGWFPQAPPEDTPLFRVAAAGANRRAAALSLPYGDQAMFVRRTAFERVGGFPTAPIMEDAGLARRLRPLGRLRPASSRVRIGGGHWRRLGVPLTAALDLATLAAWLLGAPPERIAPIYGRLHGGRRRRG